MGRWFCFELLALVLGYGPKKFVSLEDAGILLAFIFSVCNV